MRIADYRGWHIWRRDERARSIEWLIDRGEAARRAIDADLVAG
ncbi:MAG: hypothetical protein WCC01_09785 [Acidimicrobiia bacterium]